MNSKERFYFCFVLFFKLPRPKFLNISHTHTHTKIDFLISATECVTHWGYWLDSESLIHLSTIYVIIHVTHMCPLKMKLGGSRSQLAEPPRQCLSSTFVDFSKFKLSVCSFWKFLCYLPIKRLILNIFLVFRWFRTKKAGGISHCLLCFSRII